ncbi:MAG: hypothetical protein ABI637_07880 [Gemmatimonadota bacterium]
MTDRVRKHGIRVAVVMLAVLAACAVPDAGPYAGQWTRTVDSMGVTHLTIEKAARVAIRFEHPPAGTSAEMKGPGSFRGDTLTFSGAPCERGAARYVLAVNASELTVSPLGADGCVSRRMALVGVWKRD